MKTNQKRRNNVTKIAMVVIGMLFILAACSSDADLREHFEAQQAELAELRSMIEEQSAGLFVHQPETSIEQQIVELSTELQQSNDGRLGRVNYESIAQDLAQHLGILVTEDLHRFNHDLRTIEMWTEFLTDDTAFFRQVLEEDWVDTSYKASIFVTLGNLDSMLFMTMHRMRDDISERGEVLRESDSDFHSRWNIRPEFQSLYNSDEVQQVFENAREAMRLYNELKAEHDVWNMGR